MTAGGFSYVIKKCPILAVFRAWYPMDTFAKNGFFLLKFDKLLYRINLSQRIIKRFKRQLPSESSESMKDEIPKKKGEKND